MEWNIVEKVKKTEHWAYYDRCIYLSSKTNFCSVRKSNLAFNKPIYERNAPHYPGKLPPKGLLITPLKFTSLP